MNFGIVYSHDDVIHGLGNIIETFRVKENWSKNFVGFVFPDFFHCVGGIMIYSYVDDVLNF